MEACLAVYQGFEHRNDHYLYYSFLVRKHLWSNDSERLFHYFAARCYRQLVLGYRSDACFYGAGYKHVQVEKLFKVVWYLEGNPQ